MKYFALIVEDPKGVHELDGSRYRVVMMDSRKSRYFVAIKALYPDAIEGTMTYANGKYQLDELDEPAIFGS